MKQLKLEDYAIIQPYLEKANYEGYNSNFVTMMMWNHEYHIQYEIHDNFLIMLHHYKNIYFWAMPFTTPEFYQEALDYMIKYSHQHGFPFMIDCAIESFVSTLQKNDYSHQFLFERTPFNDDYIYDKDMLQTLAGKKMQKRRNHYNAFLKAYPDYEYRDLDIVKDFDIIFTCLNRWEGEKDNLSESMTSEVRGIMSLLSSKHLLPFHIGGIFIHNQLEAFIIASKLNHSTIQIHVEKANKDIRGLYPAILKELLEHHFQNEKWVNREEDMGLENLRRSKQSLHPVKMIHKYRIYENQTIIEKANDHDLEDIKKLWLQCFEDETEESTNYYFQELYHKENTFVLKNDNHILSALQIVPMSIMKNKKPEECYFILGVCTHPYFQKQGLMKQLLYFVLSKYTNKTIYLQAYHPEIYRPFGFHASHYHQVIEIDKNMLENYSDLKISQQYDLLEKYYHQFVSHFDEYRIRSHEYWQLLRKRCESFNDQILIFEDLGYFIYHEDDESIYISEAIYFNQNNLLQMLSYFKKSSKKLILECDMTVNLNCESKYIITMMSNTLQKDRMESNKYINEVY